MRVLVCGGRDFYKFEMLMEVMDKLHAELIFSELIHGMAVGADQMAARWGRQNLPDGQIRGFAADWKRFDRAAGSIRNKQMLDEGKPDLVVAFPGGPGTAHMKRIARSAGVRVIEVNSDGSLTRK